MAKFTQLGRLVETRGVNALSKEDRAFDHFKTISLGRYVNCDWGDMDAVDLEANDEALRTGEQRILAAYTKVGHPDWKLYILTEWDRSITTLLFANEY